MREKPFGFDDFLEKWVPRPPAWQEPAEEPTWLGAAPEDERRRRYMDHLARAGGERYAFPPAVVDRLKRDVAAGAPVFDLLDALLGEPGVGDQEALVALFQRTFGVPLTRARYLASWRRTNRSDEARRVLDRVLLCAADARRAGLWSAPGEGCRGPQSCGS